VGDSSSRTEGEQDGPVFYQTGGKLNVKLFYLDFSLGESQERTIARPLRNLVEHTQRSKGQGSSQRIPCQEGSTADGSGAQGGAPEN